MKRLHLFEFEDLIWFPKLFRKGITDYLEYASNHTELYSYIIPIVEKELNRNNTKTVIDLCSGSGGGIDKISSSLGWANFILTDKYPNIDAFKKMSKKNKNISYKENSVDILKDNELKNIDGLMTMFVGFHHFKNTDAITILKNIAHQKKGICIVEMTERSLKNFLIMFLTPFAVWASTLFMKPFNYKKIFFTYFIPIIPFCTMWDGIISVLRTYSLKDFKKISDNIDEYEWEFGEIKTKIGVKILYYIGYPKNK